ncbi:hypothetical protein B4064_3673 [Caldibacillus thermoamylovorans]|nr:hypothetical protein B4064_3673 [Caldibacillus thermoamylovorans]KIO64809.1 hypothetical protein B4065_2720 [Caldibacillus thermoamylovorans]
MKKAKTDSPQKENSLKRKRQKRTYKICTPHQHFSREGAK